MWIQEYTPRSSRDIIGNQDAISKLNHWINNFKSTQPSIIISGPHGVGKTIAVKLILQENGFKSYAPNLKSYKNIQSISEMNVAKKTAVIFDDSETITLTSEKNTLLQIFKDNESKRLFPLIFITNEQHSKLISDIKKSCTELKFTYPQPTLIKKFVKNICLKENLRIDNDDIVTSIIKFSQLDIRRLIYILEDLKMTFQDKVVAPNEWKHYMSFSQRKDKDIGLFDATKKLLSSYKNIDMCIQLYETEKVLLPLMVFENYHKTMLHRRAPFQEVLADMSEITASISMGDVVETNIYTDQNWYLQNIHGFLTCAYTSHIINKHDYDGPENYHIDFSSDLNKTSLKNINKKSIGIIQSCFKKKKKNLCDLLYINKILHHYAHNNRVDLMHSLGKQYDLAQKTIDMLLKVDKTLEKIVINTKGKNNKAPKTSRTDPSS